VLAVSRFQGECIRPLCHATADKRTGRARQRGEEDQTLPTLAAGVPVFNATLIRLQFSPIAAT
jgi:hypothetical protein